MDRLRNLPVYSVVVPVYESASIVELLVERISAAVKVLATQYEIILVDDGSRDPDTWAILEKLANESTHIKAVRLMRNFGKPAAVMCGLSYSKGTWIVTIDDDLQQRPEDIGELVKHRDHDVVVATYANKRHRPDIRFFSAIKRMFDRLVLGLPFQMSPLKLISRQVVDAMLQVRNRRPYIPALLAHVTTDFFPVPLAHMRSEVGKSRYNYIRRIRQFSNLLISNSGFLLRSTAVVGVATVCIGILLEIYFIARGLSSGEASKEFSMLVSLLVILNGFVLMGLGFIGEYLVRLIDQTSAKPAYVVRSEITGSKGSDNGIANTETTEFAD